MRLMCASFLAAILLCAPGCSDDSGGGCGTCPAGTICNEATGVCEASSKGCPAAGCGTNATCVGLVCACNEGFTDCNNDLGQGGDGCECSGSCSGTSCGTGPCDPATSGSCGGQSSYCDSGTCKPCPSGTLNCDSLDDCETTGPCSGGE